MSRRVLMVVGAYFPELAGGSLQCRTLVGALKDRVRFSILTTTSVPGAAGSSVVDGVPVHRVFVDPRDRGSKLAAMLRFVRLLPRLIRDHDLFHFHGFTEKMLLLLGAARLSGTPVVEKPTSLGWDDPVSIRRRPLGRLLAAGQSRADRIVAVTPAMREACRRSGVADSAVVLLPNGVDADRFAPASADRKRELRERLGLPADACLVTFVGFWSREKAPDLLFAAWQRARQQSGADTALLFIGSSSDDHPEAEAALAAAVRRDAEAAGLSSRVLFVERTDEVASYLAASDVFVLPSSREGMSNALLEAMSTGLACVCADLAGGTDSLIESGVNGWRVPAGDADALTAVLATLFQDAGVRAQAGLRARATILDGFAIRNIADRYLTVYDDLASGVELPAMASPDRSRFGALASLLGAALVIGALWTVVLPPFEGPGERAHIASATLPLRDNPIFDASSNHRGRVNAFMHGSFEGAPVAAVTRLRGLRLLSVAAWLATLSVLFATARFLYGRNDLAWLIGAIVLCVPGVGLTFATAQPLAAWALIGSIAYWTVTARAVGRIGATAALLNGAAIAGVAAWLGGIGHLGAAVRPFLSSYSYSWWPSDFLAYLAFEFAPRVFFGFVGWIGQPSLLLPPSVYAVAATACAIALCGLLLRLRVAPLSAVHRRLALVYGGGVCLTVAIMLYENLLVDRAAPTGTWLYVSLTPIAIGLVAGWRWAALFVRRLPHRLAIGLAAGPLLAAAIWASGAGNVARTVHAAYTGDPDHLRSTVLSTIALVLLAAAAIVVAVWRRRRETSAFASPAIVVAIAVAAHLAILGGLVRPRYALLDAEGFADAVRKVALVDGDAPRAADLYSMAAASYPDSAALSLAAIDLPSLDFKGRREALFVNLRDKLARHQPLNDRAELMAFARLGAMQHAFAPEILRAIARLTADTPELREPRAVLLALADGRMDSPSLAEFVRAAGGTPVSLNVHDTAAVEGYVLHKNAEGRNEVTLYFRPLQRMVNPVMWVHAYPEGSHDYVGLTQKTPRYADWQPGSLAWESFEMPSNAPFVLYIGIQIGQELGPAFPIGAVGK